MKGNKIQSRDRRSSRVQITAQDGTQQETRDTGRDEVTLNKGKTLPYIQKRGGDNVGQVKLIRALWTHKVINPHVQIKPAVDESPNNMRIQPPLKVVPDRLLNI